MKRNSALVESITGQESLVEHALKYQQIGWFVLPIKPNDKMPYIKWAYRKEKRPNCEEIKEWFQRWPKARIGIATGKHSGVDVVDLDGPDAFERLTPCMEYHRR